MNGEYSFTEVLVLFSFVPVRTGTYRSHKSPLIIATVNQPLRPSPDLAVTTLKYRFFSSIITSQIIDRVPRDVRRFFSRKVDNQGEILGTRLLWKLSPFKTFVVGFILIELTPRTGLSFVYSHQLIGQLFWFLALHPLNTNKF